MYLHSFQEHWFPFEIFSTRFEIPPDIIIYDNCCKLLNRQPSHFSNTTSFVHVECFLWRGHVRCSSVYSLDRYTTSQITNINSQVNEQANAGLQCIKGQIAYMKAENFIFHVKLFLAISNMEFQIWIKEEK